MRVITWPICRLVVLMKCSSRTRELRSFSRTGKFFSHTRKFFHTTEGSCIQSAIKGFDAHLKKSIYLLNDRAQRGRSLRIFLICCVGEQNGEKFLSANSLCKQCKWDFQKISSRSGKITKMCGWCHSTTHWIEINRKYKTQFRRMLAWLRPFSGLTATGRFLEKVPLKSQVLSYRKTTFLCRCRKFPQVSALTVPQR